MRHGLAGHDRSDSFGQPVRPVVVLGDFLVFIVSANTCRLRNKSRGNGKNTKTSLVRLAASVSTRGKYLFL